MAKLSKVLKWLVENNDEEAAELLDLIIKRQKQEIQKETPEIDIAEALRRTIMSLINEGVDVERLKEPDKRRQIIPQESDEESREDREPGDMIEDIIKRFLTEQTPIEENTLKIKIVDNHQSTQGEDQKISKYMMLARLEVGRSSMKDEPEIIIKRRWKNHTLKKR